MANYYTFPCGCKFEIIGPPVGKNPFPRLKWDIENTPTYCHETWKAISTGFTKGIFQLESQLGKKWSKDISPENLDDLAAISALIRPGCLASYIEGKNLTQHFTDRKSGKEPVAYYHDVVDYVLKDTYGVLTYQEQSMRLVQEVAGFSEQEADALRKAIGKKLPEEMAKVKKLFLEKAKEAKIVSDAQAIEIFDWIEKSQRYAFNKCTHKNTVIRRLIRRSKHGPMTLTVEQMYKIRNNISYAKSIGKLSLYKKWKLINSYGQGMSLCEDGRIRPNIIKDIYYSGKLPVYEVVLENGKSIKCTLSHSFPTKTGQKKLSDISVGEELILCGEYEQTETKYNYSGMERPKTWISLEIDGVMKRGSFTNGGSVKFKKIRKEKLTNIGKCEECSNKHDRLELHHVDGDRTNNEKVNLQLLCPGCHKKEEYSKGRVKIGEKGYPSLYSKVKSITFHSIDDVYDVEMEGPNHNFVTSEDIVTCNSHAIGYAKLGYWTAYAKYHWAVYFLTAWLSRSSEKIEPHKEVEELVSDARMYDIPVLVPDFRDLKTNFYTDGIYIRFGIGNVKTVGQSIVNKIMDKVPQVEATLKKKIADFTWYDLLFFLLGDINSRSVTSLINSGAFSYLGIARNLMYYEFEKWSELTENEQDWIRIRHLNIPFATLWEAIEAGCKKKKDGGAVTQQPRLEKLSNILQLLKKPPYSLQDSPDRIAFEEKQLLGTSVTYAKIDACDIGDANTSCKELLQGKDEKYMVVAGEINKIKECTIKNGQSKGKKMAFVGISDGVCTIDLVVFNNEYSKYQHLFVEGNTVIARIDRDTKGQKSLIVKAIKQC